MNIEEQIFEDFKTWLAGLIEDDPIPYEIKSVSFYVNKNNEIGFSGSEEETKSIIDIDFYFPLEAEYFYSQALIVFINSKADVLKLLEKLLKKYVNYENNIFKNKTIYYGLLYDKAILIK